jgi:hypothetical protein
MIRFCGVAHDRSSDPRKRAHAPDAIMAPPPAPRRCTRPIEQLRRRRERQREHRLGSDADEHRSRASATTGRSTAPRRSSGARRRPRPPGRGFQNASFQIFIIENSVSSPTPARSATIILARSSPARTSASFAKKPDSGGSPASDSAGNQEQHRQPGLERTAPQRRFSSSCPRPPDDAGDQEQVRLHDDVVDHVEDRAGQRERREQRQPHHHVADLADDVERQDAAHLVLRHAPSTPVTIVSRRDDSRISVCVYPGRA